MRYPEYKSIGETLVQFIRIDEKEVSGRKGQHHRGYLEK
jgi:hypothetical protein